MSIASGPRISGVLVTTIFLGLLVVFGLARFDTFFTDPMLEHGDVAVNALQIDNAKRFSELYGNYSRFEFNHPGPAFFYVYAAVEWLGHDLLSIMPSPSNAHLFACMAIQAVFFALGLALVYAHLSRGALLALALPAAALHFGWLEAPFVSIWPPHVLVMPFFCFLAACASVATGSIARLPIAVLAGGFLLHGHVAQPLFIGAIGSLAIGMGAWRARGESGESWRALTRTHRRPLIVAGGLGALFLLPLAIDMLAYGSRGNIATILGRFRDNSAEGNSAVQSLLYFLSFATPVRDQEIVLATLGPQTRALFVEHGWQIAGWTAVFLVPPALAFAWRARLPAPERRFFLAAGAIIGAAIIASIAWGMSQAGGMYHFNGYFYYAIYFFALLLGLALLARSLERFVGWPILTLAAAATAGIFYWTGRAPKFSEEEKGLPIQRGIVAALQADPDPRPKLLVFEHAHWPDAAAVALELRRRGVGFYAAPWWTFMFQRRHDATTLGPEPESQLAVWWITPTGPGGHAITNSLGIHHEPAPLEVEGGEIRFRTDGNSFRYAVLGLSASVEEFAWTNLPRVVLRFAPRPAKQDVRIVFEAESANTPRTMTADIFFNGIAVGSVGVRERAEVGITVPAAVWNGRPHATLELRFPHLTPLRSSVRPDYENWPGWALWKIRCEPAIRSAVTPDAPRQ